MKVEKRKREKEKKRKRGKEERRKGGKEERRKKGATNAGKCSTPGLEKKEGPRGGDPHEAGELGRHRRVWLPAHLKGKLELARIVRSGWLARAAGRAGQGIANLVDRCNVGAIEEVESIGDDVDLEALAERNAPGEAHIPLEEVG